MLNKLRTVSIVFLAVFMLFMPLTPAVAEVEGDIRQYADANGDGTIDSINPRVQVTPTGRPWLGITYDPKQMYDTVLEVIPNTPAERAGLKKGDRIVAILRLPSRGNARRYELDLGNGYVLGVYPAGEDLNEIPFRMGQLRDCCKPGDRILIIVYRDYGSFLSPNWVMVPIYATLEERR